MKIAPPCPVRLERDARTTMPESASSFMNFAKLGISRQKSKLSPTFLSNRRRLLRSLRPAAFKQGEPRRTRRQHLEERFAERHCGTCITNHRTQNQKIAPIRILLANRNKHEQAAPPCRCARFAVILPIFQERASKSSWVYGQ